MDGGWVDPNERVWREIRARDLDPESAGAAEAFALLDRGTRLLDLGCGGGGAAARAARGFRLAVGLDVSPSALALAASKGLAPVRADLARGFLPFPSSTFDAVACLDAIEHLPDPRSALSEIARVLAPGGRLVLTTINIRWIGHLATLVFRGSFPRTADLSSLGEGGAGLADGHVSFFTRADLEAALGSSGLSVIVCEGRQPAFPAPPGLGFVSRWLPGRWRRDVLCRGLVALAEKPRLLVEPPPGPLERGAVGSPRLSAVVVNWNASRDLAACLGALDRARTAFPGGMETIVVDNGSTDGSADLVERGHPAARLVRNRSNLGFARAANQGIGLASGRDILILNPDVRIEAECLAALAAAMESDPRIGAVGPKLVRPDGAPSRSYLVRPGPLALLAWFLERRGLERAAAWIGRGPEPAGDLAKVYALLGGCILLRREALAAVGPFDERFFLYAEDLDLCLRLAAGGWKVVLAPGTTAVHEGAGSTGLDPGRSRREWIAAHRLFYRKHHWRLARAVFDTLAALDALFGGPRRRRAP